MRKFLVFLLMSLMTTMAWGEKVVSFIPSEFDDMSQVEVIRCLTKDCVTICCDTWQFNQGYFRFPKNVRVTFSSTCGKIIKIVFVCTAEDDALGGPAGFTVDSDNGFYACNGNIGCWEGESDLMQFTAVTSQVRATRIDVYIDDGALCAPMIKPAAGTYYDAIEVTMTCRTSGASIYYTLDGSDPTTASMPYTQPFTLSNDLTIKAVAERDGELSEVVSAEYEFHTPQQYRCFEDMADMPDQTEVRLSSPLYAVAQSGKYLYVKDECGGYGLIYGDTKQTYNKGDVIPEGVVLNKTTYDGAPEYQVISGFLPANSNISINPEEINPAQVGPATVLHYVRINHVTISKSENSNSYILTDEDGNWCMAYFGRMGTPVPDLSLIYDVIGIVGSYRTGNEILYQMLPTEVICVNPPTMGFGMLEDVDDETEVTMTYDATVIGQIGSYLYALDETGYGMVYGNTGQTYKMGDVIPAGFGGVKTTYDGEPELKRPHDFQPPIGKVELTPEEISADQVNHSMWGHYVVIRNVRVDKGRVVLLDENDNECSFFNRFAVELPGDEDPDARYDVYGIISHYKDTYQILPLRIVCVNCDVIEGVCCISDLLEYPEGQVAEFECPLIVVYQAGNYLFVKDRCDEYTLMYGNMNGTFENGDSIIGAATWNKYQSVPQLVPYGDWSLVAHGPQVSPYGPVYIEDISRAMVHWYVFFEDVTVVKDEERDRYYTMIDNNGDEMRLYNQFNIEIPTDYLIDVVGPELNISFLNKIIEYILTGKLLPPPDPVIDGEDITWKPCRVEGLVSIYQNQLELVPTRVTYYGTNGGWDDRWYDLNNDGVINISDLNVGIELILKR